MKKFFLPLLLLTLCIMRPQGLQGQSNSQQLGLLSLMFENNIPLKVLPNGGLSTPLFCIGDVDHPCGFVDYTDLNILELTTQRTELFATTRICHFEDAESTVSCVKKGDPNAADTTEMCDTENGPQPCSCVTVTNSHYINHALPGVVLPDGIPFNSTMVKHDPPLCEACSGRYREDCCSGNTKLDYRCNVVAEFDENDVLVRFARSIAGSFLVTQIDIDANRLCK